MIFLTLAAPRTAAQTPSKRQVYVTVSDQRGRLVTGLDRSHFTVVENGVQSAITGFSDGGFPISIAIVSDEPLSDSTLSSPGDELIQTPSLSDALVQLAASPNARKVIVATASAAVEAIPAGIQFVRTDPADFLKTVIRLRHQYLLEFESSTPSAEVEVVVARLRGMPPFTPSWN